MIKYLKIKNFLSIKDEMMIDFSSDRKGGKKNNVFSIGKNTLTKNILLYGANASGKSNILRAILKVNNFALIDNLPKGFITGFLLDSKTKNSPSFFEISFFVDKKNYIYSFEINDNVILKEKLSYINSKSKEKNLFERIGQKIKTFNGFEKELKKGEGKIKENSSVISVLARWNGKLNNRPIDYFFKKINLIGLDKIPVWLTVDLLELEKNNKAKQFLVDFMKLADFSIEDIKITKKPLPDDLIEKLKEDFGDKIKKEIINIKFGHKINGTEELEYFDLRDESSGTQRFFELVGPIVDTIFNEQILFIDEIENKLHYLILKEILKFINSNIQDKKYQFFFTTHDIDLLDLDIFKKDQIAFTEKDNNQSSDFYKLSDIDLPIRKELDIKKYYKNGAFGAIPNIRDFSILLNSYEEKEKNNIKA